MTTNTVRFVRQVVEDSFKYGSAQLVPFCAGSLLDETLAGFGQFLAEPYRVKSSWSYDDGTKPNKPDGGYRYAHRKIGTTRDEKEIFHIKPSLFRYFEEHAIGYKRHLPWLIVASRLRQVAIATACQFAPEALRKKLWDCSNRHVLRLLRYDTDIAHFATSHLDESVMSFNIFTSHNGFYVAHESWFEFLPMEPGYAQLFSGMKAQIETGGAYHITPDGKYYVEGGIYRAAIHGAYNECLKGTPRIVCVLFCHTDAYLPVHLNQLVPPHKHP